jgi:HPt (histidine-containing phosphotransfer) domain-containing protein
MNLAANSPLGPADNSAHGAASGHDSGVDASHLADALNLMWQRFLPEIRERAAILEAAATSLAASQLSSEICQQANAAAHKLAGTLGTFNLAQGTQLAREFETLTAQANPASIDPNLAGRLKSLSAQIHAIIESRP